MYTAILSIVSAVVAVIGMSFYSLSVPVAGGVVIVGILVGWAIDQIVRRQAK
jgi:hypothetical protein